jgi:fibronectin-binding autotransporter adhesin
MSRFLNVVICAMLASPLCPQAATYYWDNNGTTAGFGTAGGTWAVPTASQWSTDSTGVAAPGASITTTSADPVNFGTTATGLLAGTITISGSVTNGSLTFGSTNGAVVLDGGTINLNGNIAVSANSPAATQTVNSAIVLIGSRQFGAALANERIIFNGAISGTSGSGLTADTGNGSGSITLNGTNSFPGNVTIGRGQLNANTIADAGVNSSLGAGTNITMAYGGGQNPAFVYSGASAGSMNRNFMLNGGSDYIFSQGAPLTLSGTFSNSAAGFNAGLFLSGDAGGGANINELSGAIVSGGVYTINVTVQNLTPVGGTAEEGMWKLSGNNTYTGATAVANASTLIVAHNNALGAVGGGVALTQNAQLLLMNNIAVGAEALTLNSGQGATWNGQTGAALRNYLGTNSWSGLITLSAASTIAANSGTALTLSGGITGAQNLTVNAIGDITVTNAGITTGTGTLTKSGAGRLTLAATNTYSGATTVSNGTLKAGSTGGLSSNSTFTVVAGATLDLSGFNNAINSLSTVNNGGTITDSSSPGSGGTLRITNAMSSTLNSNVFTGSLGLQFFGGGTVNTILNVTTNTYSGGTILGNGSGGTSTRLLLGGGTLGAGSPGAITSGLFGKGPITIGAAATDLSQLYFGSALTVNYDFVVNSSLGTDVAGTFRAESSGIVLAGAINANLADAAFSANNATGRTISVTGPISGPSGVKVLTTGSGGLAVTSSGTNTFSGSITLSAGTLVLSGGLSTNMNQVVTTGTGNSLILTNGARLLNTNGYSVGGNSGTIALYSNTVWTLLRYPNNVTSLGGTSNRLLVTAGGIITNVSFAGGNILAINGNYGAYQVTDGGKVYLSAGNILLGQGTSSDNTILVGGSGASSYFSANLIQMPQITGTGGRNGISVTNGTLDCFGGINLGRTTASQNFVRVFANGLVNMNDTSFVIADGGASIGNT